MGMPVDFGLILFGFLFFGLVVFVFAICWVSTRPTAEAKDVDDRCIRCGYSLAGHCDPADAATLGASKGRCPECGTINYHGDKYVRTTFEDKEGE